MSVSEKVRDLVKQGSWIRRMFEAGIAILGACCGSTPAHIAALRERMNQFIEAKNQS